MFNKRKKIIEFALSSLLRKKYKNLAIIIVFSVIISIISSILFLTNSLKKEAFQLFVDSPAIVVQKLSGGRHELIDIAYIDEIKKIAGVGEVQPRFWGYYFDSLTDSNYTLLAIDSKKDKRLDLIKGTLPEKDGQCAIGAGVARVRLSVINDDMLLPLSEDNELNVKITGVFSTDSNILTNDLIVLTKGDIIRFFDMPEGKATDLTVEVFNDGEVATVAKKIKRMFPATRPIQKSELVRTYDTLFNWRGGMMIVMFVGALAAFAIFAWDKATGLSAEERREIGILKAIGWETSDVLELKFWEGFVVSILSFLSGIILAYVHVYFFGATLFEPALKGWSVLFPQFTLLPFIDTYHVFIVFFLTVAPYVASTIIPSWKAAIAGPDSVMRS
ncbi:MAG: FtsX-like permease family protein [Candidatus Magnetoovum sp. WYHC-5]|nr:FtsX-like permease family protein [Candidatus Magnetoovum sp. WYHC-5]